MFGERAGLSAVEVLAQIAARLCSSPLGKTRDLRTTARSREGTPRRGSDKSSRIVPADRPPLITSEEICKGIGIGTTEREGYGWSIHRVQ